MKTVILFALGIIYMKNTMGQDYTKLENYLDQEITGKLSPGVQFIIADSSGVLYQYNNGLANIDREDHVSAETQFRMCSSTKLLTMIAIMQLVEQGKIKLDAPVSDYLSFDFPEEVTIRNTLSHTAGFSRYPFIKEIHLQNENDSFNYSDFIEEMLPKHKGLTYKSGTKNRYSNFGYLVLSAIVEKVSGLKYEEYIKKNISQPVQLAPTDYLGFKFTDSTATGYVKRRSFMQLVYSIMVDTKKYYGTKTKDWQSVHNLYIEGYGFGGGFANAKGLAKIFTELNSYNLLNEETLLTTFEPQHYKNNKVSKQSFVFVP